MRSDALKLLTSLVEMFPGLLDGETEVNGSDLVEELTVLIDDSDTLRTYFMGMGHRKEQK